jgi:ABC-2 type transport system permease protein
MAVYKRTYRGYAGPLTPAWSRFLVLYRFARRSMFQSKFQTGFFTLCFFFPLLCLLGIYANAHLSAFSFLRRTGPLLKVDGSFFFVYMSVQSTLAFLLTAFLGPGLVSPDLANGALTLYLYRPLSRTEYVLGKMSVLVITLSWLTWIPGLVLFFTQASVGETGWLSSNWRVAAGIVAGSFLWILVLSLLSLALSAWVKWRIIAGALLLAVFFLGAGFAQAVNGVLQTEQGYLLDVSRLIATIEHHFFQDGGAQPLSVAEASVALLVFAACFLVLLMRKIRPNEVIE